jgi:hypothetical protein
MSTILKICVHCDNSAFEDDPNSEISRILRYAADNAEGLRPDGRSVALRDRNGNSVGVMQVITE